jgi:RNA polymerase sigma-70 factor (ECF subfamily)
VANFHRDNSRHKNIKLNLQVFEDDDPDYIQKEEKQILMKVINILNPDRQQLLILKFVNKLSNREIAQIMGRTEGAIKALYHRTLVSLRSNSRLREYFYDNLYKER